MAFPGLCRKLVCLSPFAGSRQASAFPILNVGWIPTQHPQKSGSSLSPENSPFQITARPYSPSAPVSVARAGDQAPGRGARQMRWASFEGWPRSRGEGTSWELEAALTQSMQARLAGPRGVGRAGPSLLTWVLPD